MSEVDWYKGKIRKVEKQDGETLEDLCKRILDVEKFSDYYEGYEDELLDTRYNEYISHDGELYEVVTQDRHDEWESEFTICDNKDGTFDYSVRYYNGGCCFSEAINYAFEEIKSKEV